MRVVLGNIEVEFDNAALRSMLPADATLSVEILSKDDLTDDVKALVGDSPVFDISFGDYKEFGGGKVTLKFPFEASSTYDIANLKVCYILDGKIAEKIDCTYADGIVTFSTGHFSMYAIMYVEPEPEPEPEPTVEPDMPSSEDEGDNTMMYTGIAIAAVAMVVVAGVLYMRRN